MTDPRVTSSYTEFSKGLPSRVAIAQDEDDALQMAARLLQSVLDHAFRSSPDYATVFSKSVSPITSDSYDFELRFRVVTTAVGSFPDEFTFRFQTSVPNRKRMKFDHMTQKKDA